MSLAILLLNLFSTVFMTGVIWVVQIVHYPLFQKVGEQQFVSYEAEHQQRISWIVIPPMLLELGTSVLLLFYTPDWLPFWATAVGLLLTLGIWLSTFGLSVPQHQRLRQGFEATAYQRLVLTNWPRTLMWSIRSILLSLFLFQALTPTA